MRIHRRLIRFRKSKRLRQQRLRTRIFHRGSLELVDNHRQKLLFHRQNLLFCKKSAYILSFSEKQDAKIEDLVMINTNSLARFCQERLRILPEQR